MGNEKQKISVRWPITIISGQETLEAESRNITVRGIFVNSPKELRGISRIFQMIIHGPKKKSVLIRAKLAWANCDEKRQSRSLSGGSFFFLESCQRRSGGPERTDCRSPVGVTLRPHSECACPYPFFLQNATPQARLGR